MARGDSQQPAEFVAAVLVAGPELDAAVAQDTDDQRQAEAIEAVLHVLHGRPVCREPARVTAEQHVEIRHHGVEAGPFAGGATGSSPRRHRGGDRGARQQGQSDVRRRTCQPLGQRQADAARAAGDEPDAARAN